MKCINCYHSAGVVEGGERRRAGDGCQAHLQLRGPDVREVDRASSVGRRLPRLER